MTNKENLSKDFLTIKEAAEMLDITENTLRETIRKEKLKAYKKFNRWYIFKTDLNNYLKKK